MPLTSAGGRELGIVVNTINQLFGNKKMPRYAIERQYLVPMFEHIFVEAPNFEEACRRAVDDLAEPWSDLAELDFDNSRATTVARAVEIPEHLFPDLRTRGDEDRHRLSQALYDSNLDALAIPADFAGTETEDGAEAGFG